MSIQIQSLHVTIIDSISVASGSYLYKNLLIFLTELFRFL